LSILDDIYDSMADDVAFARLPKALAAVTRARSGLILDHDPDFRVNDYEHHYYSAELTSRYMAGGFDTQDVWTRVVVSQKLDQILLLEDFVDATQFRQTFIYNELFRHCGDDAARCMAVMMPRKSGFMSFAVHRAFGDHRFNARDAQVMSKLLPHLRRLVEMRDLLGATADREALARATLDTLASALLITDASGRIRIANAGGEDLLQAQSGIRQKAGRLTTLDPRQSDRFAAAIRSAALRIGRHGDVLDLPRGEGMSPLRVLIAPLAGHIAGALILIEDPEAELHALGTTLSSLYGLTQAEAEVAVLLVRGRSLTEIATRCQVSRETARSQAKTVYDKAGVDGQIKLMSILKGLQPRC